MRRKNFISADLPMLIDSSLSAAYNIENLRSKSKILKTKAKNVLPYRSVQCYYFEADLIWPDTPFNKAMF
jgi:hypothetical protein